MATVQLTDVYNPTTFAGRTQEAQVQLNRFLASGVAVFDEYLQSQIRPGGMSGELTNYNPLTVGEPTYSSDNPASSITPANIADQVQRFKLAPRAQAWSAMDFARDFALQDPVGAITGRIGKFWAQDDEQRIINSLMGILADNDANDGDDMLIDVATDDATAVTDAERIGGDRVIDALQTLGDHKESITTLCVHSAIHARLQKQNLIDYVATSDSKVAIPFYMGKRLIVDDSLPAVAGTNRITYTCVMFAPGVIATANGNVQTPSEIVREALTGDGGGQTIIVSRVNNVWHPVGFDFVGGTLSGNGGQANYANLALAANWNRIFERKNIPLVFIQVND